ncbi:MAG: hypothetical protein GY870_19435 [archaeon]|nr:hypothetical protein [archaeon]
MKLLSKTRNYFLIFIFLVILIPFINIQNVNAQGDINKYEDSFPLQTYDSRFYIINLNEFETINISVTAIYEGDFDIFFFRKRPNDSYIQQNTTNPYNAEIFEHALIYDISSDSSANITYQTNFATDYDVNYQLDELNYYIQVVLKAGGTDTFTMEITTDNGGAATTEIYFIPYIPGFPIEFTILFTIGGIIFIWFLFLRKKIQFQ